MSKGHNSDNAATLPAPDLPFRLSGSQAKTAFALRHNAETMIAGAGLPTAAFLTLTVGDRVGKRFVQVWDAAEASRRIDNLRRRVLPRVFERAIIVTERHVSGAIHFHLLGIIAGRPDIRTGFNFAAVEAGDYSSACPELRALWAMLRETLPGYGFGRAELTPIKKTGEAVASYVSKYVEKHLFNRRDEDKGRKLVRYHGWQKRQLSANGFHWATRRAIAWRNKARQLAALVGVRDKEEVAKRMGPRWAFRMMRIIRTVDDDPEPKGFAWIACPDELAFRVRRCAHGLMCEQCRRWARQQREQAERDDWHEQQFSDDHPPAPVGAQQMQWGF